MISKKLSFRQRTLDASMQIVQFICRLITWIGCLVIGPGLLLSLVPLILWKSMVTWVSKLVNRGVTRESLSFFDTVFAVDDFYAQPYAGTVKWFVLDGHLSLQDVRKFFCDKILYKRISHASDGKERWKFQRLHQVPRRFWWFYFWKEIPINTELHFSETFLKDGDSKTGDSALCGYMGALMTKPFPDQSGLWEIIVVNNYEGEKTVVILRVHHVIADGYSLNTIVDEMMGKKSQYLVKEKQGFNLRKKLHLLWTAPAWAIQFFTEEMFAKSWMSRKKENTTGVLAITSIPLDVIKSIRRKTNCHFATIGLSLIGGALQRSFLEDHVDGSKIPDFIKIMHLLPKPNHPFDRMCNHWSAGSFKVSLKSTNALERLREAESNFREFTENNYHELLNLQSSIASLIPAPIYSFILSRNYLTSMSFTSLPGYDGPAQLCGLNIVDMYKVIGLQYKQTALGAAAYSHNGQLAFSIFANRDIVSTQESAMRLTQVHLQAEVEQLVELLALDVNQV